jgi:hypothetical protein
MRSSTSGFVFGCALPEPDVPHFGDFVLAPAQRGQADVVGLVYDIVVQDDAFVRPLVAAAGGVPDEYIEDQRVNRQVPVEVSVVTVGFRANGGFEQGLPPQPPVTLDKIRVCPAEDLLAFTEQLDFLRLVIDSQEAPGEELAVAALRAAIDCRPAQNQLQFRRAAGRALAKLLGRDLPRLERMLRRLQ